MRVAAEILASVGVVSMEVERVLVDGEVAVALVELTCTDAAGEHFVMPVAEEWSVEDGVITRCRPFYFDTAALVRRTDSVAAERRREHG